MKYKLLLLSAITLLLALTRPACGQGVTLPPASDRFAWTPPARATAAVLSNVTLGLQLALDTVHSFKDEHRSRALWREACSLGAAQGLTWTSKKFIHQLRPDGSDDNAFFSGHTATAAASSGWRYSIGIPLTLGTGYLRMAAAKHDIEDVAVGAGVGLGVSALCNAVIK